MSRLYSPSNRGMIEANNHHFIPNAERTGVLPFSRVIEEKTLRRMAKASWVYIRSVDPGSTYPRNEVRSVIVLHGSWPSSTEVVLVG